jgi:hypothetical protein
MPQKQYQHHAARNTKHTTISISKTFYNLRTGASEDQSRLTQSNGICCLFAHSQTSCRMPSVSSPPVGEPQNSNGTNAMPQRQHNPYVRASGTRPRRIQIEPPAQPRQRPITTDIVKELCTFWNFDDYKDQPSENFDRAERLLYDLSQASWASENERRGALACDMMWALAQFVRTLGFTALGFTGLGGTDSKEYFTAYYDEERDIPQLPEWLPEGLIGVEKEWGPFILE